MLSLFRNRLPVSHGKAYTKNERWLQRLQYSSPHPMQPRPCGLASVRSKGPSENMPKAMYSVLGDYTCVHMYMMCPVCAVSKDVDTQKHFHGFQG